MIVIRRGHEPMTANCQTKVFVHHVDPAVRTGMDYRIFDLIELDAFIDGVFREIIDRDAVTDLHVEKAKILENDTSAPGGVH